MATSTRLFTTSSLTDIVKLGADEKCRVLNTFWPHLRLGKDDFIPENYAAFFEHIGKTLKSLHSHANSFAAQDLDGLLAITSTVRANQAFSRKAILETIKGSYLNTLDADIVRSVELGLRFWLGINISSRDTSVGPINPRDSRVEWPDAQPLGELVKGQFKPGASRPASSDLPLEGFTAVKLRSICRLHIRWTDNLIDHLKLEGPRGQRSLSVYRHKICLINHRKEPSPTVIPSHILDEAIRSLDLLFPFGDPKTEDFLREERVQLHISNPLGLPLATGLEDFKYWRPNLVQLLSLLNGPPETVAQTLFDTRNLSQFATLWVAIFGVFGLTILFGCLSTVYAIKQYQVAVKAYELSLALACAQSGDLLPQFCK